jgi:predicted dehydrogenase
MIGSGDWATVHAKALSTIPEAEITAVTCGSRAAAYADTWDCTVEPSVKALVARPDVDAVVITTPHSLHKDHALMAIDAGKHILLEKPMAISVEECDRINAAAKDAGVTLMIAQSHRYWSGGAITKKLIQEGALGDLVMGRDSLLNPGYIKAEESGNWRYNPELAGRGYFLGYGVHIVDRLRWWFNSEVESVFAKFENFRTDLPTETTGMVFLNFRSGACCTIWSSCSTPRPSWGQQLFCGAELLGTKGIMDVRTYSMVKMANEPHRDWQIVYDAAKEPNAMQNTFVKEDTEFISSVFEKRTPAVTGEDGRAAVEICLAAYESSNTGEAIKLPFRG